MHGTTHTRTHTQRALMHNPYATVPTKCFVFFPPWVRYSVAGVTGARAGLPADLTNFIDRVRAATDKPLSVGFGISSADQVKEVASIADGVVVGSAVMTAVDEVR